MALVVAAEVYIAPLLTTTPKHEGACLGLRRRVGLDPALLVGLLQTKLSHALSRCLALVAWLLNGLGHGPALEDLVVARLTCCAAPAMWCLCLVQEKLLLLAGHGQVAGSWLDIYKGMVCYRKVALWQQAKHGRWLNSNWWQVACWSRQATPSSGLEPGGSLLQQSSPS
ncbi:hypothetical protein FH972_010287 [Carpinus fangiana]|uniref:Uncharacterized protein n=1 Tax=Carpinus fangiana TaxID=176857 RepID=A0A660KMW1_9ROSI|nr:hypothetical protein FH972_010287 [Carpinus fangiana]